MNVKDSDVGNKYDRQVRLWSPNGQQRLGRSAIALIKATTTGCETLKNLVLPGVGRVVIIDAAPISAEDLASNFFLTGNEPAGALKAPAVAHNLGILNSDVTVEAETRPLAELVDDASFWTQFDCVVDCSTGTPKLAELLWHRNVCLVDVNCLGFYGSVRVQYSEQDIVETHDNNLEDLRLDCPWPELKQHIDSLKLEELTDSAFASVPYSVILSKVYAELTKEGGAKPTSVAVRRYISHHLSRTGDEANLEEASNRAYLVMKDSRRIPANLETIFADPQISTGTSRFWTMTRALKQFYDKHGVLPLSGVLPDMESDTQHYMALSGLYHAKFEADKAEIRGSLSHSDDISDSELATFVKNCRFMQVHRGSQELFSARLLTDNDSDQHKIQGVNVYLSLLCANQFYDENGRFPGNEDRSELRAVAISLLCRYQNVSTFPNGLEKVLDELCRAEGTELHNIAALLGGIASQEVIKVLTDQYVTLENCMSYDGIGGNGVSWKL